MKRLGWVASIIMVFSLAGLGCTKNNEGMSGVDNDKGSFQQQSSRMAKQAWSTGKKFGRQVSNRLDDEWIHGMIMAKLIADSATPERNIDVDVHHRVVTLRGQVERVEQKKEAERVAKQTRGVRQVNNLLDVSA